ncbi:hypothetical protein [Streptomyces goshikiensis]|uniref:hypothetical protein n=1 Tax=Streptomyces goshikiensis TaxID=1942 RepID=UPI0036A7D615
MTTQTAVPAGLRDGHPTSIHQETHMNEQHPTDGPVHAWFELTYSSYLVLPRTLMQSMPIEWQQRMVGCLEEIQAAYAHLPQAKGYQVHAGTTHLVSELDGPQLDQLGITEDWYRGETPPEGLDAEGLAEWEEAHEDPDGPVYHRDGQEIDGDERVVVPGVDPVPHYNRGRTYIEPRLSA